MRIRLPFAGAFATLTLLAAYLGLSAHATPSSPDPTNPSAPVVPNPNLPTSPILPLNDKALHFLTFFLLTLIFYWILDTSRRRVLHLTLLTITLGLGIGSEFVQAFLPNGRVFDVYDIAANVLGSLGALAGCTWYHMRMLERKRVRRGYGLVTGVDDGEGLEEDLELGHVEAQEEGVLAVNPVPVATGKELENEVDNWDENIEDAWDEDVDVDGEPTDNDMGVKTPSASSAGEGDAELGKKRSD